MSDKVDLREFRERISSETGGRGVEKATMANFEKYRASKYGKRGTERDSYKDMKMQFGEMKLNQIASKKRGN